MVLLRSLRRRAADLALRELGAAAAYLGRRGASGRGGWLQRSADWLVSSEQRAAIDIAGIAQLDAPKDAPRALK